MKISIIILLTLLSVPQAFAENDRRFFAGYELFEMSMNNFKNFAGEVGYKLDDNSEAKLVVMNVSLTERHLSNKYEAHATDNKGNVDGRFKGYELSYDRFFTQRWYYMVSAGWFHYYYQHTILGSSTETKSLALGTGIGYKYPNLLGVENLYLNFSYPVRYYFNPLKETKLGNTLVHEHKLVNNLWLFIGYTF